MAAPWKIRAWRDSTGGDLEVDRWDDGDVIFRSIGVEKAVLLNPEQLKELFLFAETGE